MQKITTTIVIIIIILLFCNNVKCNNDDVMMMMKWRPVVLMHGLLGIPEAMNATQGWIQNDFPGIYILNVQVSI